MPLKFYFVPNSTSNFTTAVLSELEFGRKPLAERVQLSLSAGDTRTPQYLSTVNPNGQVPAIVHDGVSIWESAAITMYLGETFGVDEEDAKKSLYPAPGPKRGEAMKWIVWTNVKAVPPILRLFALKPPHGDEQGSEEQGEKRKADEEKARKDVENVMGILDGGLEGRDYLLGEAYSLTDTHVWGLASWVTMLGVTFDAHPNVKAWMARVGGRPALKHE